MAMLMLAAFIGLSFTADAQRGREDKSQGQYHIGAIMSLKEELKITPEQTAQLETLQASFKEQATALRSQTFEDQAARQEAMKSLRQSMKDELEDVLTAEQQAILKEKRADRKNAHHDMRKAVKVYREAEMKPVLQIQRAKLETALEEADKARLEEIRSELNSKRQAYAKEGKDKSKRMGKGEGEMHQRKHKGAVQDQQPLRDELKAMAQKYDSQISRLMEEIEHQAKQWYKDMQAIREAYAPDHQKGAKWEKTLSPADAFMHNKQDYKGSHPMKKERFLLMKPEATEKGQTAAQPKARVFPNPATTMTTLAYDLETAGDVTIVLRAKEGVVLKTLPQGRAEAGPQQVDIPLDGLNEGVYYISIQSGKQQWAEKLIIARQ